MTDEILKHLQAALHHLRVVEELAGAELQKAKATPAQNYFRMAQDAAIRRFEEFQRAKVIRPADQYAPIHPTPAEIHAQLDKEISLDEFAKDFRIEFREELEKYYSASDARAIYLAFGAEIEAHDVDPHTIQLLMLLKIRERITERGGPPPFWLIMCDMKEIVDEARRVDP